MNGQMGYLRASTVVIVIIHCKQFSTLDDNTYSDVYCSALQITSEWSMATVY